MRFHFLLEGGGSLSCMMCNTLLMEKEQVKKHTGIWKVFWMSRHFPFHRNSFSPSHGERQQVSMNEMERKHFGNALQLHVRKPKVYLHSWKYSFTHKVSPLKRQAHQRKKNL